MNYLALRMLIGDRAKYVAIVFGLTFASLLITQQGAIFTGFMTQTYGFIDDMPQADIWVMDPEVEFIQDFKPLRDTELQRVRSVRGVDWAVPLYTNNLRARLPDGSLKPVLVVGVDDATFIGAPPVMAKGRTEDLRRADAVIIDETQAESLLAMKPTVPGGKPRAIGVGDYFEVNGNRALIVATAKLSKSFWWFPVVYTTYSRAIRWAPPESRMMTFVLVKAQAGADPEQVCRQIEAVTGQKAITSDGFRRLTMQYVLEKTGIGLSFGITVLLGVVVGTAVAGQTFFSFTLDNLRFFGTLKAMGTSNLTILRMIILQAIVVGVLGYGIGVGGAALFGYHFGGSIAFKLHWALLLFSGLTVAAICSLCAGASAIRVLRLEPAIVFKG